MDVGAGIVILLDGWLERGMLVNVQVLVGKLVAKAHGLVRNSELNSN